MTKQTLQRWFLGDVESTITSDCWHSDERHSSFTTNICDYVTDFVSSEQWDPQWMLVLA